jgi:hypothetical protein
MLLHTMFVKRITQQEPVRCALLHRRVREESQPRPPLEAQEGRCA